MPYVTMNDLACCGLPGLGQVPATITAATVQESGIEKLRRRLCEPVAILAMAGAAAGVGLWLMTRGSVKANPRSNVIYGGMSNVRCIKCRQLKSYDDMAKAPGSAVRDDRDGQYYGLCESCRRDEEILRTVFAAKPTGRAAKKGAKAARKKPLKVSVKVKAEAKAMAAKKLKIKAKKRNDEQKPPSIADLMKQSYDRQHSIRGGQAK